jgi:predicted O-methyltransferase YrrM
MDLSQYLKKNNISHFEGHSQQVPKQVELLNFLSLNANSVLEIGFNVGHSAELFLSTHPSRNVLSFDIGQYKGTFVGKEFLDSQYPSRHTLIIGDSTTTLPNYISNNPDKKFDLIFIDGGHSFIVSNSDLVNCQKLAHKDTIVIMDDTVYKTDWQQEYTIGPTVVWLNAINSGFVKEYGKVEFENGRGMSWGKYTNLSDV